MGYKVLAFHFQNLFKGPDFSPGKNAIPIKKQVPLAINPGRMVPFHLHDKLKAKLPVTENSK